MQPLKRWTSVSTASVSMGQEIAVTPIQMATAFSAICNGGHLLRPRVVAAVVGDDGEMIEDHTAAEERRQALDPDIAHEMVEMLHQGGHRGHGQGRASWITGRPWARPARPRSRTSAKVAWL